jgi:heat shock protein HspQ
VPDTQQLPSLLRLYDDPSETVRKVVLAELAGWGETLEGALASLDSPPPPPTVAAVLTAVRDSVSPPTNSEAFEALVGDNPPPAEPFEVGQLVQHVRYGYRGVIVALDDGCQAPKAWYLANNTRPRRDQPWYHVLVHDSSSVTYAAQTSLAADSSEDDVRHPLLPMFFDALGEGRYLRNKRPWPPVNEA